MGTFPHSVATIVLMTIPVAGPRLATGISPGKFQNDQLIGAGLFRHRVRDDGSLAFELSTRAVGIWADDDELVSWLEAGLDDVDVLAGYRLRDVTLPLLVAKSKSGADTNFDRLAGANEDQLIDLTAKGWFGRQLPFAKACRKAGIAAPPDNSRQNQACWFATMSGPMRAVLGDHAVASWKLWLHGYNAATRDGETSRAALDQLASEMQGDGKAI